MKNNRDLIDSAIDFLTAGSFGDVERSALIVAPKADQSKANLRQATAAELASINLTCVSLTAEDQAKVNLRPATLAERAQLDIRLFRLSSLVK